jgi:hypothetical protein
MVAPANVITTGVEGVLLPKSITTNSGPEPLTAYMVKPPAARWGAARKKMAADNSQIRCLLVWAAMVASCTRVLVGIRVFALTFARQLRASNRRPVTFV